MQIHELNNFSGTLGSGAYLAIDDGNDTGKISSQGLLAATEARIDNIIAGEAPSAAEVVDARLGADGVTYTSLGTGIRTQFTDVKSDLNYVIQNDAVFTSITWQIGGFYDNGYNNDSLTDRIRSSFITASTDDYWIEVDSGYQVQVYYYNTASQADMNKRTAWTQGKLKLESGLYAKVLAGAVPLATVSQASDISAHVRFYKTRAKVTQDDFKIDHNYYAYFTGNKTPSFAWNNNGELTVTFPTDSTLNISNVTDGVAYTYSCTGQTFTLTGSNHLRFNTSNGQIYALSSTYVDSKTIVLLTVSRNGIGGILSPFYNNQEFINAYMKGQAYAYFSGPSTPTFAIASDKTSLKITMPSSAEMRIYYSRGLFATVNVNGESYSLNRAGGRLVYDMSDGTIKNVLSPSNSNINEILLLSFNWIGCDGLLANYVKNILNFDYRENVYPVVWRGKNGAFVKNDFSCVFITDIHAQVARARQAVDFANAILDNPLSCIINGGDTVALHQEDGVAWWNTIVSSSALPVLSAIGNHDASISDVEQATALQTYNLITAEVASTASITQPTGASINGYNYYYKDFNSKVRVIVIDPIYWDSTEKAWFESVLASALTSSLAVICVSHYPFEEAHMTFPKLKRNYDAIYGDAFTPIDAAVSVKSFMDNGGVFIAWMCGHTHCDGFGILEQYGNQGIIISTTLRHGAEASPVKSNFPEDTNYNAFDVISVDMDRNIIKDARIGACIDWHNVSHPRITYNYMTHEIIEG